MRYFLHHILILTLSLGFPTTANASFIGGGSSGGGGGGITSINSDSSAAQTITSDSAGTDIAVATSSGVTTISVPSASTTNRGVITTGAQNVNGIKTFGSMPILNSGVPSTVLMLDAGKSVTNSPTTSDEVGALHGLTASRVLGTDAGGLLTASGTSTTRLSYLDIDSSLVALLAAKVGSASPTFTGNVLLPAGTSTVPGAAVGASDNGLSLYTTDTMAMITNGGSRHLWYPNGDQEIYGTSGTNHTTTYYGSGTSGTFLGLDNSTGGLLYIKSSGSGEATTAQGIGTLYISGGTQAVKIRRDGRFLVGSGANTGRGGMIGIEAPADNTITGTTTANASTTISGSSTVFLYQVSVGDQIALSSASTTFATVTAVASNTSLTVDTALGNGTSQTIIVRRALLSGYNINNSDALTYRLLGNGQTYQTVPDDGTASTLTINAVQASVTGSDTFIDFRSSSGSEGSVAGTGVAGVIAYNTFTGSHWTKVKGRQPKVNELLCAVDGKPGIANKDHLFETRVCDQSHDAAAIGAFGGKNKDGYDTVLSIGTGYLIVKNSGFDLKVGEYLTSSNDPGRVEAQEDNVYRNHTVGKLTQAVKWKNGEAERLVSVIYLGG